MNNIKLKAYNTFTKKFLSNEVLKRIILPNEFGELETLSYIKLIHSTGLKDINGAEIFEGDIVKYFRDELAIVKIDIRGPYIEGINNVDTFWNICGGIEIVGSIYTDFNLMEEFNG